MIRLASVKLWEAQREGVIDTTSHEQYMLQVPSAGADLGLWVRSCLSGGYPVNLFFPSPSFSSLFSLKVVHGLYLKAGSSPVYLRIKNPHMIWNSLARATCGYFPIYTLHRLLGVCKHLSYFG